MTASDIENALRQWAAKPRLEKAVGTKIHHIREAVRPNNVVGMGKREVTQDEDLQKFIGTIIWDRVKDETLQIFVVEHDWASAFASAGEEVAGSEYQLPYRFCLFEFEISKRRLAIVAFQRETLQYELHGIVEAPEVTGWAYLNLESPVQAEVRALIHRQVRAICVALEAEVAETEIIRVPEKLAKARDRRGKPPLSEYRIVRLSRRDRPSPLPDVANGDDARRSPRLHFRRGHWVHFANHRTWRKWTLVGNPDLGFIDKHYRL